MSAPGGGTLVDRETGEIVSLADAPWNRLHHLAQSSASNAVQYAIQCGDELRKEKAKLKHGEWKSWVEANCQFSYRTARAYMQATSQTGSALPVSLRSVLAPPQSNHLTNGTRQNEWYTPPEVVDRVTAALGGIDLDPASNDEANETVRTKGGALVARYRIAR